MPLLNITVDEVKRRKIVSVGWYHMRVEDYKFEKSKDGESFNHTYHLKGLEGEAKDVPFMFWISEKAPGMGLDFVAAYLKRKPSDFEEEGLRDFDPSAPKGAILYVYNEPGEIKGTMRNQLKDFAPPKPEFSGEEASKF